MMIALGRWKLIISIAFPARATKKHPHFPHFIVKTAHFIFLLSCISKTKVYSILRRENSSLFLTSRYIILLYMQWRQLLSRKEYIVGVRATRTTYSEENTNSFAPKK